RGLGLVLVRPGLPRQYELVRTGPGRLGRADLRHRGAAPLQLLVLLQRRGHPRSVDHEGSLVAVQRDLVTVAGGVLRAVTVVDQGLEPADRLDRRLVGEADLGA